MKEERVCPVCNKNIIKNYYAKQCFQCYQESRAHYFCIDCGKSVRATVKRCRDCNTKYMVGENNKTWTGGLPKCKECGCDLSTYKKGTGYCQKCYVGEKTRRWNPNLDDEQRENGRSINPDYYKWRIDVFERDDYTCQRCGDNKGGNLVAHHISGFSENKKLRTDINNGITLCSVCHLEYHTKYGYKNSNTEDFTDWHII